MMPKLEAQERLKPFFNPDHASDQLARLKKLPSNLSTIGQILAGVGPAWEKLQAESPRHWRRWDTNKTIVALSEQERQLLFAALFPGIAAYVEDTWKLFDLLPYQSGYQRRPFRSPSHQNFESRITWLQSLSYAVRGYEHQNIVWLTELLCHREQRIHTARRYWQILLRNPSTAATARQQRKALPCNSSTIGADHQARTSGTSRWWKGRWSTALHLHRLSPSDIFPSSRRG
jgi:hypothetical protein